MYFCCDKRRRNDVKEHPTLNGIDFLEVLDNPTDPSDVRQRTLFCPFLKATCSWGLTERTFESKAVSAFAISRSPKSLLAY